MGTGGWHCWGTGGWHSWAQVGGTGGWHCWAQVGGNGGWHCWAPIIRALIISDHQCPDDRCRSLL
ncbi:unnamed protein product [Staurois parvus]|uniref:Uncharacterized protein n=1 Tax=Staurois parvus TaxID=386267 RepID=A0ABN9G0F1_9NEOB|nr:unnamed protein product [Staurois parvus]